MTSTIERLYWHSKILSWKGKEMTEKEFKMSFFQWRIPKTLRYLIMKGMEKDGLIKIEKGKVYMNNYYFDEQKFKGQTIDFKDADTKKKKPYIPISSL